MLAGRNSEENWEFQAKGPWKVENFGVFGAQVMDNEKRSARKRKISKNILKYEVAGTVLWAATCQLGKMTHSEHD